MKRKIINMEFRPTGVVEMVNKQPLTPYYDCLGVYEILREYPHQTTYKAAVSLFMLGYIEGKRAERARRKK